MNNNSEQEPIRTDWDDNDGNITLHEILKCYQEEAKILPIGTTLLVAKAIWEGLVKTHGQGLSNGFVLPEQIQLLEKEQKFLLGPPCINRPGEQMRHEEDVMIYVSPEFAIYRTWSSESDIFSAGIVLWQCLMSLYPFQYRDNECLQETIQHLVNDPPLLSAKLSQQPDDRGLLALALVMLAKDPQERPLAEQLLRTICTGQIEPAYGEIVRPLLMENPDSKWVY